MASIQLFQVQRAPFSLTLDKTRPGPRFVFEAADLSFPILSRALSYDFPYPGGIQNRSPAYQFWNRIPPCGFPPEGASHEKSPRPRFRSAVSRGCRPDRRLRDVRDNRVGRGPDRLLPVPGHPRRHRRLRLGRRPVDGRRPRRPGPPSDLAFGHRSLSGRLARRADAGLLRPVRGPDRGLYDAPRRRTARAPHLRGPGRDRRRLDAGRQDPLRHTEVFDPAQYPARRSRPGHQFRIAPAPRPGGRRFVRRLGKNALFHAPPLPGQLHQEVQRRNGPEPLVLCSRRPRSVPPDGGLRRHEQEPAGLEGPRLLSERPRRPHEHLVHGLKGRRAQPAHFP